MANCFVIMPFRPELTYLYRSIKGYIESTFQEVTVARGDDRVLTTTILEKIREFIEQADVVIADISGRNPNVFYELGMAHALGKSVVLITSDEIAEAPTDIRSYEFISYGNRAPDDFLARLEAALGQVVGKPYAGLYPEALGAFEQFKVAMGLDVVPVGEADFESAVSTMYSAGHRLPETPLKARAEYLIKRLLGVEPDIELFISLKTWLDQIHP
jgi:hypothetical protein